MSSGKDENLSSLTEDYLIEGERLVKSTNQDDGADPIFTNGPSLSSKNTVEIVNCNDQCSPDLPLDNNPRRCFSSKALIYTSHFLSSWGDRMWMFAGGLFLLKLTPGSLQLAAIYGTVISLSVIIFGAAVGKWVDHSQRLAACRMTLFIQNLMVCLCAGQLVFLIRNVDTLGHGWLLYSLEGGVILTASIAQLGSLGSKLAIEKDWIVVICSSESKLASMNSTLRTIDLSTQIFAPVVVGIIMTNFGPTSGGVFIAVWNVVSLVIEYSLLHCLFYSVPALRRSKHLEPKTKEKSSLFTQIRRKFTNSVDSWKLYFKCEVRNAGLALATLYMTILAFDNYSRGYIFESGISETLLGVFTALSSLSGILGAVIYPHLRTKIGVAKTGLFGFIFQTSCLVLCVASVFAPGTVFDSSYLRFGVVPNNTLYDNERNAIAEDLVNSTMADENCLYATGNTCITSYISVGLLIAGIVTSRCGLWVSDLSITQLLQERVPVQHVCTINGVQSSLNEIMSLMRSVLLIILPTIQTFGFMVFLSFFFVAMGGVLFAIYTCESNPKDKKSGDVLNLDEMKESIV